jgi:NADP-dependent 3-hydroxy acid dehydrogenase YdfG
VRLSLVSPGPTDTSVWDPFDPDRREGFIPRAGMLRPGDVAEAILFVATRPQHVHIDWLRLGPTASTAVADEHAT